MNTTNEHADAYRAHAADAARLTALADKLRADTDSGHTAAHRTAMQSTLLAAAQVQATLAAAAATMYAASRPTPPSTLTRGGHW